MNEREPETPYEHGVELKNDFGGIAQRRPEIVGQHDDKGGDEQC